LTEITNAKECELVYRATTDGFTSDAFHSKCDNKPNLVSIIRNNLNYVFGGYTSVAWNTELGWITDTEAFIFSLRRNGESKNDKFMILHNGLNAFYASSGYHLWHGSDIVIIDSSNTSFSSFSDFGRDYELPAGIEFDTDNSKTFIAGNYNEWLTTEIEVYKIKLA
jgi:BTB/POZ domain-containing protein KCTD9